MKEVLERLLQKKVVVDTRSAWIYIGILEEVLPGALRLIDVDVHDSKETTTSKELYTLESSKSGIKANRKGVYINLDFVVSVSALDEVIHY